MDFRPEGATENSCQGSAGIWLSTRSFYRPFVADSFSAIPGVKTPGLSPLNPFGISPVDPFLLRRPELRRTGRDKRRQRGVRESGARTKRSIEGDDEDENGWEDDDDWETVNLKTFHLADM
jgi:hypothetical protein